MITGITPKCFRAPYGDADDRVRSIVSGYEHDDDSLAIGLQWLGGWLRCRCHPVDSGRQLSGPCYKCSKWYLRLCESSCSISSEILKTRSSVNLARDSLLDSRDRQLLDGNGYEVVPHVKASIHGLFSLTYLQFVTNQRALHRRLYRRCCIHVTILTSSPTTRYLRTLNVGDPVTLTHKSGN